MNYSGKFSVSNLTPSFSLQNEVLDASLQDIADDEQDLIKQLEELRNENARTMKEIIELEKVLTV